HGPYFFLRGPGGVRPMQAILRIVPVSSLTGTSFDARGRRPLDEEALPEQEHQEEREQRDDAHREHRPVVRARLRIEEALERERCREKLREPHVDERSEEVTP